MGRGGLVSIRFEPKCKTVVLLKAPVAKMGGKVLSEAGVPKILNLNVKG